MTARSDPGGLEVAGLGLVHLARVDLTVGQLDGAVAVLLLGPDLRDDARSGLDDGHRDDAVVLVEDLGHTELFAQHAAHLALLYVSHEFQSRCRLWVEPNE